MFLIYTKLNCPYCIQAKALLKKHSKEFEEIHVSYEEDSILNDKLILRENFIKKFPLQKTLPLIFEDDEKIGGFQELKQHLEFDF